MWLQPIPYKCYYIFFTCSRTEASETWASVMYQWHMPFGEMKQNSPIFIASNSQSGCMICCPYSQNMLSWLLYTLN